MLKNMQILLGIFVGFALNAFATLPIENNKVGPKGNDKLKPEIDAYVEKQENQDPAFTKAVEDALVAVKKEAPDVHEQALKVWKNFDGKTNPNFTYRFWARSIIMWLKDNKKIVFDSDKKVADVFLELWKKGKISRSAAITLSLDSWGHLVYLQGLPAWESRMENQKKKDQGKQSDINKSKSKSEAET
ncbi:MAG: hypothetical protein FJX03_02680 [Alphaproteobacteria bacterium]|nr:hypothetical protein [Alphaproteobacteria bacterium]